MSNRTVISIVDDDKLFRESMRRLVMLLGYAVEEFSSATDFLESRSLLETACLVADVHMPVMTGVELYRELIATGHAIPTILITAYPEAGVRQQMLSLGVGCYLHKPLDEAVLIDCLCRALARDKTLRGAP